MATRKFKETICRIHAKNYQHLATNEIKKINTLVQEAKTIYNNTLIQETLQRAREQALNNAREIKRQKTKTKIESTSTKKRKGEEVLPEADPVNESKKRNIKNTENYEQLLIFTFFLLLYIYFFLSMLQTSYTYIVRPLF